jgi:MFS family permease
VITLRASAGQIGVLNALQYIPVLLITPFLGVFIENRPRRPLIILANFVRAALVLVIPLCAAVGWLDMTVLWLVALVLGSFTALFDVALQAFIPILVPKNDLVEGNSKIQATYSIAQAAGPGIGSLIVSWITPPGAMLVNAITYLVAGGCSASVHCTEHEIKRPMDSRMADIRWKIWEGLRYVVSDKRLAALMWQATWFNLFEQMILTVYIIYAVRRLGLSVALLGLTISLAGVGSLAGAVVAGPIATRVRLGVALIGSMGICSLCFILIPLADGSGIALLGWLGPAFLLYGLGLTVYNVYAVSVRQAVVPSEFMVRVTATFRFFTYGAIPIGALLGGLVSDYLGLFYGLLLGCVLLPIGWVVFTRSSVRKTVSADIWEEGA